jgi:ATP-dependent Clp protease ATP-binding subunit ClpA
VRILIPSYNRYSHHARRALTHADSLVMRLRQPYADTGHLLVGVLLTRGSIGAQILQELNLDAQTAEHYLIQLTPSMENPPEEVLNADEFNAALALAADESAWLGHHYIGTEHLLLGITRNNVGNARALLGFMDISPEQVRRHVRRVLTEGARELDLQASKRNARLTELSRRVINAAEMLAVKLDHPTVGLGHLLLIMLQEERSPISALLREAGLDEARLAGALNQNDETHLVSIEVALDRALDHAESFGSHYTGTEHLLLTLAAEPAGATLLRAYGIDPEALRARVKSQLQS